MRIGDLAAQTGTSVRSLRYYEEHHLLTAERTVTGQRIYGPEAVERVRLLRQLYGAGLTSTTIAALLPCVDSPSSAVTRATIDIMHGGHDRIDEQISALVATRDHLSSLIEVATAYHREHDGAEPELLAAP